MFAVEETTMVRSLVRSRDSEGMIYWAAGLALLAGVIHGIATTEYWNWWWGYAAFFLYAAICQVTYGLVLFLRPWRYDETGGLRTDSFKWERPVLLLGVIGNGAIIVLYIITRTIGIPFFGPGAGTVLPITPLSAVSKIVELMLVASLIALIRRGDLAHSMP